MRMALAACALAFCLPAQAQFATGGSGTYRDSIFWVNWGSPGEDVYAGRTITRGFNVGTPATAANRVDITCSLSNAAAPLGTAGIRVYTPGGYVGDGLDNLYNIGPIPNTLTVGLATNNASTVEFDLDCSATLGGVPFPLRGLVFADAESTGPNEYVAARLTSGGTIRMIDQISQCGEVGVVTALGNEVRFSGPASICHTDPNGLTAGPALVGYVDGATSARVIAAGGGVSAVAVGAVLELEYSEAIPSSFGIATHILEPVWSGGIATTGVNYNNPANLATRGFGIRLGATILPDQNASGAVGGSDVDALPKTSGPAGAGYANVALPNGIPGSTYQIAGIACAGPAAVVGWIDFNGNGAFDAGERSATVNCPSGNGSVTLGWTLPADYLPQPTSHLRLRLASSPADIANPAGVAADGEVEDYRLKLPSAFTPGAPDISCYSNAAIFNTAYNGDSGPALPSGIDPVWQSGLGTAAGGPGSVAVWQPSSVGNKAPGAWIDSPFGNANWISLYAAAHAGEVDVYHRYTFNLDPVVDTSLFELTLDFYTDNSVAGVYVNGVLQSIPGVPQGAANPYFHQGFGSGDQATAVLAGNWASGTNTIVVHVKSAAAYQGFLAQASGTPVCPLPTVALSKVTTRAAGGAFDFSLTNTAQATGSTTTTSPGTPVAVDGDPANAGIQAFTMAVVDTALTITEADLPGWRLADATCTASGTPVGGLGTGAGARTYTIPASEATFGKTFACTFTNEALADLRIDKTGSESVVESGAEISYTIAVANDGPAPADGAVITDPQPVGLDCSTGTLTCGSETGGAVCPASPTVAGLQGAGLIIPVFPAGGSLQFTLTCTVTASGLP